MKDITNHVVPSSTLELWGGLEGTVNRVGDHYFDQVERSGHSWRLSDLDLFAALGLRALRYPILWERTAPHSAEPANWTWADERLGRLRALGIRPIVGLVHHGSGPRHTSLVDPSFAEGLAVYARAVAERYPWVDSYTPVNEPLTTARFSGLYGHWYPHHRDDLSFARALLNQCRGIVLAMQAIRTVNPAARLMQTDDLGTIFSTPALRYQADFENDRRWITFDLLCGRVDRHHPMWSYLRWAGVEESEIAWFAEHPCPPGVIGINHYLTSDRFLDDQLRHYPVAAGGNGRQNYADVEAVRVREAGIAGPGAVLRAAWERYRRPLAITEAHLGCTREEQLRWLVEVWATAADLRREGVDLRAVTVWSLLGAYDWNSLVTRADGHYEPGVFDLRAPQPRPTALAYVMRDLAAGRVPAHPVLAAPGWWRRPQRFCYGCVVRDDGARGASPVHAASAREAWGTQGAPILITGASTALGRALARACAERGLAYRLLGCGQLDITEADAITRALDRFTPWALINAGGYAGVDAAENDAGHCDRLDTDGPACLAAACARRGLPFVTFSSDLVFDGARRTPYVESDPTAPLNVYGRTLATAEARVLDLHPGAFVARTGPLFDPSDGRSFVAGALRALETGRPFVAAGDVIVSPTYIPDLVHACLDLLIDGERGIWHLANQGAITWAELARQVAELLGVDPGQVIGRPVASLGRRALRPAYSVLGSERGDVLPTLHHALARYVHAWQQREVTRLPRLAVPERANKVPAYIPRSS